MPRRKAKPGQIPLFDVYPKAETPGDAPDVYAPPRIDGTVRYFPPFEPLPIVEDRTPEQLKADGDDKWPDGKPYIPPPPWMTPEGREAFIQNPEVRAFLENDVEIIDMQSRPNPEDARSMPYVPEPGEPGYEPPEDIGPHERRMMALQAAAQAGESAPSAEELYGTAIATVHTAMEVATAETDAAIQQVEDGATEFDKLRCRKALDGVISEASPNVPRFTSDDVWFYMEDHDIAPPREPRLLGAIIREYQAAGRIRATSEFYPSTRRHKTPIRLWEVRYANE